MIRPLIVAAFMLASLPTYAQGLPGNCFSVGQVVAMEEQPAYPRRLRGDVYEAVRSALNAMPPITDYDGPIWVKRMGDEVLIGVVPPAAEGIACFGRVSGDDAKTIIALMQPT